MESDAERTKKERRAEAFLKTVIILGAVCAVLCVVLLILGAVRESAVDRCMYFLRYPAIGFFACGAVLLAAPFLVDVGALEPDAELETAALLPAFFEGLTDNLTLRLAAEGYSESGVTDGGAFLFRLYEKTEPDLHCFAAVLEAEQMDEAILEAADGLFSAELEKRRLGGKRVSLLLIAVAETESDALPDLVRNNVEQELRSYKYSAGIVRSTRQALYSDKKDGPAIRQYKKLRKVFLRIIDGCTDG